jgi:hypothetical protein
MKPKLILLLILLPMLCYSQLSTNEAPVSWTSQDVSLQRQTPDVPQVVVPRLDLDKPQKEDLIDEQNGKISYSWLNNNATDPRLRLKDRLDPLNVTPSGGGTWEGLDSSGDCILYIENQTLTINQTFTNACPVVMRNVTITNGANIVVNAQEYILLESNVEVINNSSLSLSIY